MIKDLKGISLFFVALVSRFQFLWAGYGREFDAWSNALNARVISETGVYEVSRLPGHPLQELLLSFLWPLNHSYFLYNFLSALFSAIAVLAFYNIARKHKIAAGWYWALAFNFIPVFFIVGTSTMDYNFALAFILLAYWGLLNKQYIWLGIALGLATGFRISSLGFLLPFSLLVGWNWQAQLKMGIAALLVFVLCFYIPFETYGFDFLDFHKPPFPGWPSVLYKLSIGIWGLPFLIFLAFSIFKLKRSSPKGERPISAKGLSRAAFLIITILLQLFVFIRLPFKAEFFIPALPFILLFLAERTAFKFGKMAAIASLASLLLFGFDYKSPWRGASAPSLHFEFKAGDKNIYCAPFQGPLFIDQAKRKVRSQTVLDCIEVLEASPKALVVAGWYWPELIFKYPSHPHQIVHYSSQTEIDSALGAGMRILYLPEIGLQNAIMEGHDRLLQKGEAILEP